MGRPIAPVDQSGRQFFFVTGHSIEHSKGLSNMIQYMRVTAADHAARQIPGISLGRFRRLTAGGRAHHLDGINSIRDAAGLERFHHLAVLKLRMRPYDGRPLRPCNLEYALCRNARPETFQAIQSNDNEMAVAAADFNPSENTRSTQVTVQCSYFFCRPEHIMLGDHHTVQTSLSHSLRKLLWIEQFRTR